MENKLDRLSFIQLNKDILGKGIELSQDLYLPLLNDDIKSGLIESDSLNAENILRGIFYLYAHDDTFNNKDKYLALVQAIGEEDQLLSFIHSHLEKEPYLAYEFLKGYYHLFPESVTAAVLLTEYANALYSLDGDDSPLKESIEILKTFEDTGDFRVLYHLAHMELYQRNYEEAKVKLTELLSHEEAAPFTEEISKKLRGLEEEAIFLRGKEALFDGHYDLAVHELSKLDENFPKMDEVYFFLGLSYRSNDQFDLALEQFQKGMILTEDLSFKKEAALCLLYLERFGEAEAMMRDILTREQDENVQLNLGISLLYQDKKEEARNIFERLKDNETIGELAINWLNYLSTH